MKNKTLQIVNLCRLGWPFLLSIKTYDKGQKTLWNNEGAEMRILLDLAVAGIHSADLPFYNLITDKLNPHIDRVSYTYVTCEKCGNEFPVQEDEIMAADKLLCFDCCQHMILEPIAEAHRLGNYGIKIVKGHPICPDCGDEMYIAPPRVSEDDIHDRYVCYGCHNVFYLEQLTGERI